MISIVIPVYNEAESICILITEIVAILLKINEEFEIIIVNDGSKDNTQAVVEKYLKNNRTNIKIIQFRRNFGKAAALDAGFKHAKGEIIITMDGDLQDDPKEIPRFIHKIKDEEYDLISGWKQHRKDSLIKNKTSKFFNYATSIISNVKLHDYNCGFKAYKSDVTNELTLYGELHRFIPVIVAAKGYKVTELLVEHRPRKYGTSKYGPIRFINGFLDLTTVLFITKFKSSPLHMFGYLGLLFFLVGFIGSLHLVYVQVGLHESIGKRPLLLLSVMFMIMGMQIGITGIVGEQIAALVHKNENNYSIKKISGESE